MGKYKEIKGDLLEMAKNKQFDIIVQNCNCQKLMGAGVALHIKEQFPKAWEVDKNDERSPMQRLGDMTMAYDNNVTIVNLYAQYNLGRDLNYAALKLCLYKLNKKFKGSKIGLPAIGCGIAGGDLDIIKKLIKEELKDCDITLVLYKNNFELPFKEKLKNKFRKIFKL